MKQPMVLLHGLFGQLSNWDSVVDEFSSFYDIYVPMLPIYETPKADPLGFLVDFVSRFIEERGFRNMVLVGNSLGGHVAVLYTARHPDKVAGLVLTGSSGLYENTTLGGYPRRSSVDYIRERVAYTFYDARVATPELVADVLSITTDTRKCMGVLRVAKSAQRHYVADILPELSLPTLLIWGKEDRITPVHVAREFASLIPNAKLVVLSECGHAPMMEKPGEFNAVLQLFLHEAITVNCQ